MDLENFKEFKWDYEKEFYDILLPDGTIIGECWPNAWFMIDINNSNNTKYWPWECMFRRSKETKYHK